MTAQAQPPRGIALPVVVLLLLSLTALGHGALLLSQGALAGSRASAGTLQARLSAESGVREGMAILAEQPGVTVDLAWAETGALSTGGPAPGIRFHVGARRLGSELFLLESTGWREGNPSIRRIGRTVWLLDPLSRVADADGVVEYGGDIHFAPSVGSQLSIPSSYLDDDPEGLCTVYREGIDSILSRHRPLPATELSSREPPSAQERTDSASLPGLGLWDGELIMSVARPYPPGTASPAASSTNGRCLVQEPSNWGSPSDPHGPCGSFLPLVGVDGSLLMDGGEGQGILLVSGDLQMVSGASFSGIVLVSGHLHLGDDTRIRGFVRVGGSVYLAESAHIRFSPCAALPVLEDNRNLAGALPTPGGSWILPF